MLEITTHYHGPLEPTERLTLPFELRQRSRLRCMLDSGEEAGLILERGTVLRGGDRLQAQDGRVILVLAAAEQLSIVTSSDPLLLARVDTSWASAVAVPDPEVEPLRKAS